MHVLLANFFWSTLLLNPNLFISMCCSKWSNTASRLQPAHSTLRYTSLSRRAANKLSPWAGSKWWNPLLTQHWEFWLFTSIYRKTFPSSARAKPVWYRWVTQETSKCSVFPWERELFTKAFQDCLQFMFFFPPQRAIQCGRRQQGENVTENFSHGKWDWHCSFVLHKNSGAANCPLTHKISWQHH